MDIETTLQQFGLDNKGVKVYLALLQLGKASVLNIAAKAGIKRPTAYLILDNLIEKGLASKIPRKGKTTFYAEDPKKLVQILEKRQKQVEKIIPDLLSIYNIKADKPKVLLYEGKEGVEQVYTTIMNSKEIWWFGSLLTVYENFKNMFDLFEERINSNKIKMAKDFIGNSQWEINYAKNNQRANHEIRISPLPVEIDFSLFEDKVAILSHQDNLYAVVIQDKKIVESFKSLYELAWSSVEKVKK
ncbi:hypothetical protein KKA15_01230 [Patescibacteria group bacterium]|nr:hypothetical protein [Patescibacteria group bacterium]